MKRRVVKLLVFIVLLAGLFLLARFLANTYNVELTPTGIRDYLLGFGAYAAVVYIIIYTVRPLILFPASVISISGGLVFGPLLGTVYTVIGASLGAIIAFVIAKYFGSSAIHSMMHGKLKKIEKMFEKNAFVGVLFLRLVPLFPFDFVNYGAGLLGVGNTAYIVATVVGIIPGTFAYSYLGNSLADPKYIGLAVVVFAVLTGVPMIIKRMMDKKKNT